MEIKLTNPDYKGYFTITRHACRGLIIKDDLLLVGYEKNIDQYIIPGGGVENNETYEECCIREVLEETGINSKPIKEYLVIEELFGTMKHINHYFICDYISETDNIHLTESETKYGLTFKWMKVDDVINIFSTYEKNLTCDIPRYGLYRREFLALKEYLRLTNLG